ncbi:glycosyl hydrolase family 5 [Sporanaerobium hydrogeniformans]|uniref:Glycosyl hydrolase family 5 n=1 Tax=Sporanaerobium hydrogeniformans TaxID=3072179 RepID=A0AC61DFS7_9FIRM|nr:glycoside hydrolase family 5 protein [Sporanaerobium hydrogeniformans]PHV71713.1 glycosyl hydrolase family 5 [Sporanaerobium hydrogeniformans]
MFKMQKILGIFFTSFCFLLIGCNTSSSIVPPSSPPTTESTSSSSPLEISPSPSPEINPQLNATNQSPPLVISSEIPLAPPIFPDGSPVALHGALHIEGRQLLDTHNKPFQLRGISTHGIQWFGDFVNEKSLKHLRDDWKVNVIRLAMYTDTTSGYSDNPLLLQQSMQKGIEIATELGLYVIVDWHILSDGNPNTHLEEATIFFDAFSRLYKNYPNILFELCNEPNGPNVTWEEEIKPYAEKILACIRSNSNQSIIIVGTPTWCQNILAAAKNPLEDTNCLYALHFYASTHTVTLRTYLQIASDKYSLPLIVSEFGTCEASGDGAINFTECDNWIALLDDYTISWVNWSLCDKPETSALLNPGASFTGPWQENELTESGRYIKALLIQSAASKDKE